MTDDKLPDLPELPGFAAPDPETAQTSVPAEPPKRKRGRPRKSASVASGGPAAETPAPAPEPPPPVPAPPTPQLPEPPPSPAPEPPTPQLPQLPQLPESPPPQTSQAPQPPSVPKSEPSPPILPPVGSVASSSGADDPDSGREAAKLLRRSLDDMTSSVLQMESLFRAAPPPGVSVAGSRHVSGPVAGKHGKHARQQFQPQRGGHQSQPPRKGPPAAVHADANLPPGGAIASRFGAAAAAAARAVPPAPRAAPVPAVSPHSGIAPQAPAQGVAATSAPVAEPIPDLPVVRLSDLRGLSCADLLSLAREQRIFEQSSPRRKSDLVFQLAVKHALRGGMVECEGHLEVPTQAEAAEASVAASAAGATRAEARLASHNCYLRSATLGFSPDPADAIVSQELRDRHGLRQGDKVVCRAKFSPGGPFGGQFEATDIVSVNDGDPARSRLSSVFDAMPCATPSRRIRLRSSAARHAALDVFDVMSPLAFGQRALLVAQDASRLHEVLSAAAAAISVNHPAVRVVLAEPCAMPEDFPDGTADAPGGPAFTFCSTRFDDTPDKPVRLVSLLCESARRLVEGGRDVVLLLGSVPEFLNFQASEIGLAGKRGASCAPSEDSFAAVRRLFASARQIQDGGSLTVVAAVVGATGPDASPRRSALLRALLPATSAVLALDNDGSADAAASFANARDALSTAEEAAVRAKIRAGEPPETAISALPPPPAPETPALPVFVLPR